MLSLAAVGRTRKIQTSHDVVRLPTKLRAVAMMSAARARPTALAAAAKRMRKRH